MANLHKNIQIMSTSLENNHPTPLNLGIYADFLEKNPIALVDFWAPWCPPCRALAPTIDGLVGEYKGRVGIGKVNIDQEKPCAEENNIRSLPTLIFYKNGHEKVRLVGNQPIEKIREQLDALLALEKNA